MPHSRLTAALVLSLTVGLSLATPAGAGVPAGRSAPAAAATPGAPGTGDPFFPSAGNGGYDALHYRIQLDWQRQPNIVKGSELIFARATQALTSFNLDFREFEPGGRIAVQVNGKPAAISRDGQELTVTPKTPLRNKLPFVVRIEYSGTPIVVIDPDGSPEGWVPTTDGVFVAGEPQGSPGWFAVNDNPADKATYDVAVTVPNGLTAVGNGALVGKHSSNGKTEFHWFERYPMSSYLVTITIGKFDVTRGRTPDGVPTYIAVDPTQAAAANPVLARLLEIVDYFSDLYGRYPFETVGAIVDDAPDVGYALETQTKPIFDQAPDELTLVHEIAHQWFGDAVTLTQWPDIWLNEGFAAWSEWIWTEQHGGAPAHDSFAALLAEPDSALWNPPPPAALPGPDVLFSGNVYNRGAMTLQALREKIGDDDFFCILRSWYAENRYGNVTTAAFIDLSETISGQDLTQFFDVWLRQPAKPTAW